MWNIFYALIGFLWVNWNKIFWMFAVLFFKLRLLTGGSTFCNSDRSSMLAIQEHLQQKFFVLLRKKTFENYCRIFFNVVEIMLIITSPISYQFSCHQNHVKSHQFLPFSRNYLSARFPPHFWSSWKLINGKISRISRFLCARPRLRHRFWGCVHNLHYQKKIYMKFRNSFFYQRQFLGKTVYIWRCAVIASLFPANIRKLCIIKSVSLLNLNSFTDFFPMILYSYFKGH